MFAKLNSFLNGFLQTTVRLKPFFFNFKKFVWQRLNKIFKKGPELLKSELFLVVEKGKKCSTIFQSFGRRPSRTHASGPLKSSQNESGANASIFLFRRSIKYRGTK